MAGRTGRRHSSARSSKRKWDDYRLSYSDSSMTSGTVVVHDVFSQFKTDFGAIPFQATLGPIRFDLGTAATGTGTSINYVSLGFLVGPATLDAADLDLSSDSKEFWWTRQFYLDNSSGQLKTVTDEFRAFNVRTMRTLKSLGDTLWLALYPSYGGFTASSLICRTSLNVGILYA